MKDLTIEQKAKAYDNAKYIMKEYLESGNAGVIAENTIKKAFPELEESDDERIREEIKVVLANTDLSKFALDYTFADMLAWLEKQGGQNPADKVEHLIPQKGVYYVCIKDYYSADGKTTHTKGKIYKSPCDGYINDDKGFGLSWINSCTENHFRPVKEKDWIVCEQNNVIGKPLQYKEFMNELIQKNIKSLEDRGIVPNLRLWNIFDAKDGDILFAKGSYFKEYVFIYSGMTEDNVLSTYCGFDMVHNNFDTKLSRFGRVEDFETVFPATKEQREQLLKAMADAGYTFDFEKKELKKIEKNHAEWSEEDEKYFKSIAQALSVLLVDPCYDKIKLEHTAWFQSLKDRYTWRPSDEQLEALVSATENCAYSEYQDCLRGLIGQLKKLK